MESGDQTSIQTGMEAISREQDVRSDSLNAIARLPWFALQVRSRYEKTVASYLDGKGYEWFLPTYQARKRWSDRVKEVELALFPGYLFCRFDPQDRLPILKTPGMISIVGNVVIMKYLVGQEHLPYMMANIIAIGCCSVANFLCSEVIVFRKTAHSSS